MPKTTITYRIFIGAPSDIVEEKLVIKSVADEMNNLNLIKNLKLEVIDWKSSTYPRIGEDAQDVINTQINDDYDIFIGLFWHKFGTATKRNKSGTKEEFERAYNRYLKNPKSVHILMYFKTTPISIDDIDTEQIRFIKEFEKEISERGVLFRKFSQSDEFSTLFRTHLSQLLNEISNAVEDEINSNQTENSLIVLDKNSDTDELGYFEYIDIASEDMIRMTVELDIITKQTELLGNKFTKKAEKLNSVQKLPSQLALKESRKLIDSSANDLDIFNKNVAPAIPVMHELFNKSMDNFNKAILIHKKYLTDKEGLSNAKISLQGLKAGITFAYTGIYGLTEIIKQFPPLTNKLLKSKKESVDIMTNIGEELMSYINITDNIIDIIVDE